MPTLWQDNFDGGTSGTALSTNVNYTCDNVFLYDNAASRSAPNSIVCNTTGVPESFYWHNQDTNNGDCEVGMSIRLELASASVTSLHIELMGRANAAVGQPTNLTHYIAELNWGGSDTFQGLHLKKRVNGVGTDLTSPAVGFANLAITTWYDLWLKCVGSTISSRFQRWSDGFWMDSTGTWGAAQVNWASVPDASIGGPGYWGMHLYQSSVNAARFDDYIINSIVAASARPPDPPKVIPFKIETVLDAL